MENIFSRTELLFGKNAIEKLSKSRVAVFGIGGVGSFTVEALVRSGIGCIDIIDNDKVSISNINRQLFATTKTVGKIKVDVAKERLLDINPELKITGHKVFINEESIDEFDFTKFDYVVDAIDTVSGKIAIIEKASYNNIPIISAMGAGNKIDATKFDVADIYETEVCPLAKVMRKELKKRGIKKLKVVYSKEIPVVPEENKNLSDEEDLGNYRKRIPGSNSFVPPVVGLIIAGEVIKDLIKGISK